MSEPQKDEHIEELLSKLQGIFGKLSHSEEDPKEEKPAIEIPAPALKTDPPAVSPQLKPPTPATMPAPSPVSDPMPIPIAASAPVAEAPSPAPAAAEELVDTTGLGGYESTVPLQDPEKIIVPTAIFYPPGRTAEAKIVAQKLETMTPKFTKVAFRLRVIVFTLYDPKSEWKEPILAKSAESHFETVFVLMDRPMDDGKRKSVAAELEGSGVYFQDVLTTSIEKKAFYTDVLLGLVFFFDSRKPNTPAP